MDRVAVGNAPAPGRIRGPDPPLEAATLSCAMEEFRRRGFTDSFKVVNGRLRAVERGATVAADDVVIRDFRRVEGVSDPDDMAIVYAVETSGGIRGTLTDAFGVYADPAIGAVLSCVPIRAEADRAVASAAAAGPTSR